MTSWKLICHTFPVDSGRVLSLVKQKLEYRILQRTWQIHSSLLRDFQDQGGKCWPETSEIPATSHTRGKFLRYKGFFVCFFHVETKKFNPIVYAELLIYCPLLQEWYVFVISQSTDVTATRTAVLCGLPVILGDESWDFFKTCFVSCLYHWVFIPHHRMSALVPSQKSYRFTLKNINAPSKQLL